MNPTEDPYFRFRSTGRTTRMVEEALAAVRQGKTVNIVVAEFHDVDHIRDFILDRLDDAERERLFVSPKYMEIGNGTIRFFSIKASPEDWDWRTQHIRGVGRETPILIDHHAFERSFGDILQGWLKYYR